MISRSKLFFPLALLLFTASASAASVYVISLDLVTANQQFGTVDLATGAFQQIRSAAGEEYRGLVPASNGSFLSLGFDGNLTSINPTTGLTTVIGPTGLSDCSTPASPCGPHSAGVLAGLGGTLYATDFSQNLYTVNPATGATTLIGTTGIPPVPFPSHFTSNPDGTANVMSATLFAANGNLYATFNTARIDFATGQETIGIPNSLYQINPETAVTTRIAPTADDLTAVIQLSGTSYAFNVGTGQLLTLDLANGQTSFAANVDPALGYIEGAVPTPEPFSSGLLTIGIAAIGVYKSRRRGHDVNPESTI
jgi:hypothetical protein